MYDLGPNNTRINTPYYDEIKQLPVQQIILNKKLLKASNLSDLLFVKKDKINLIQTNIRFPNLIIEDKELNIPLNS